MKVESITHNKHIEKYMTSLPVGLHIQKSPIQIYPLEKVVKYLKYPTPLLKPQYNFIIHITNGQITGQVGTEKVNVGKGSIILMMANRIIARNKVSDDLKGFCTIIENTALTKLINNNQFLKLFGIHPTIQLKEETHKTVQTLNKLLLNELNKDYLTNLNFSYATLQAILSKLLEEANINSQFTRQEEIAFGFQQLVHLHFNEQKELSFYAQQLNVSDNYLNRCVKQIFQKPPKSYLTEITIQKSQIQLQDKTKEIAEIAYELNFNDPSYFGRLFKKITGKTPSEYRNRIMQDMSEY